MSWRGEKQSSTSYDSRERVGESIHGTLVLSSNGDQVVHGWVVASLDVSTQELTSLCGKKVKKGVQK